MTDTVQNPAQKRFAAITTVRNDTVYLQKWVDYYGQELGIKNLFVFIDGHDQTIPEWLTVVNTLVLPHLQTTRSKGDSRRARAMSDLARGLFGYFDAVIVTDVDEFLVVDPNLNVSLAEYLSTSKSRTSLSGLGMDVGQHLELEAPLDPERPFLDQRQFAHLSARYTKPSVAFHPVTWGSGMHRIKGHNFHIDPNLFLFHFGMVDFQLATGKTADTDRLASGWSNHLSRREALFKIIAESEPVDGDAYFPTARKLQTYRRPIYAFNKPGMIRGNPVVKIPERFRGIV
ncbi:MAG: glycosyltransferase family 2 protein [Paracoccaceae bacterium]|jgi:hypothetical protein